MNKDTTTAPAGMLELNLPAKVKYFDALKRKRRNDMRFWRKQKFLLFANKADFNTFLEYTKWYKRPVEMNKDGFLLKVTFLDYKGK